MFSFDPVGSYERETYRAGGSASALLQPLLDNQVGVLIIFLIINCLFWTVCVHVSVYAFFALMFVV